jgi:hypothetical protein
MATIRDFEERKKKMKKSLTNRIRIHARRCASTSSESQKHLADKPLEWLDSLGDRKKTIMKDIAE